MLRAARATPSSTDAPASHLYRNDGGKFIDVTAALAPALLHAGMVTSALFTDVDGDGWLDLLVAAHWQPIRWLKNDLHICGLDLQKLSDLPANLERLLDVKLEVTKRTKGDNENVYFNRRLVLDEGAPGAGGGNGQGGAGKDDIPF